MQETQADEAADVVPAHPPLRARAWATALRCARWSKAFVIAQWLPLCFLVAVLVAMLAPAPGKAVASVTILGNIHLISTINIFIVFAISGLVLNTADLKKAASYWGAITWGFASILFITALLGFALRAIPLTPPEFAIGFTIFACVPTTLGVGEALVRASKGNASMALLLLVGTNMLGIATMPPVIKLLLHGVSGPQLASVTVDALSLFLKLLVTVLVPAVLGKAARDLIKPVGRFATKWKKELGMFSTVNLAFIIWQTMSGAQAVLVQQQFVDILYVILLAIGQHTAYLLFNFSIVLFVLRTPLREAIAVGIMSSQKSAPVAVTVISYLTSDVTTQGLLAVPCICGQLVQIFMGSAFSPSLARMVQRKGPDWLPFAHWVPFWHVRAWRRAAAAKAAADATDVEAGSAAGGAADGAAEAAAAVGQGTDSASSEKLAEQGSEGEKDVSVGAEGTSREAPGLELQRRRGAEA